MNAFSCFWVLFWGVLHLGLKRLPPWRWVRWARDEVEVCLLLARMNLRVRRAQRRCRAEKS